jgi:hypothetical protein
VQCGMLHAVFDCGQRLQVGTNSAHIPDTHVRWSHQEQAWKRETSADPVQLLLTQCMLYHVLSMVVCCICSTVLRGCTMSFCGGSRGTSTTAAAPMYPCVDTRASCAMRLSTAGADALRQPGAPAAPLAGRRAAAPSPGSLDSLSSKGVLARSLLLRCAASVSGQYCIHQWGSTGRCQRADNPTRRQLQQQMDRVHPTQQWAHSSRQQTEQLQQQIQDLRASSHCWACKRLRCKSSL